MDPEKRLCLHVRSFAAVRNPTWLGIQPVCKFSKSASIRREVQLKNSFGIFPDNWLVCVDHQIISDNNPSSAKERKNERKKQMIVFAVRSNFPKISYSFVQLKKEVKVNHSNQSLLPRPNKFFATLLLPYLIPYKGLKKLRIVKKRSFAWKEGGSSSGKTPPSILATRSEDYSSYSYHKRDHSLLADFADRSGEVTLFQEERLESTLSFESSVSLPLW